MKLVKSVLVTMLLGIMAIQMAQANSNEELFRHIRNGNLTGVKYSILKGGADINARNDRGKTALYEAINTRHGEIAEWLIEKGADVNESTPLILMVTRGDIEGVKYLISKGADVNIDTPLYYALEYCKELYYSGIGDKVFVERCGGLVKSLVENGADVNVKTNGITLLEKAIHLEIVKILVEKGADINVKDEYGDTLLMKFLDPDIIKYLIEKGLDVNAKNKDGQTPLMYAVASGSQLVAEYLVAKGADINAKDKAGNTALNYARSSIMETFIMNLELGE